MKLRMPKLDKTPPHAIDVEEIVLGALMLEKDSYNEINGILKSEMFYIKNHELIYMAIEALHDEGEPVDIATVCNKMKLSGNLKTIGGPFTITQLTARVASTANIVHHALILKQYWIKREIIRMGSHISEEAFKDTSDSFQLMIDAQSVIDTVSLTLDGKRMRNLSELALEAKQEIIRKANTNELPGLSTGFPELDEVILGIMKSNLIIVAARPGMGKTAFVTQIAKQVASIDDNVIAFFSLEMKDSQLVNRLISGETSINSKLILLSRLSYQEQKAVEVANLNYPNFIIDDQAAINLRQLRNKCMKIRAKKGRIDLIIIDYLQLMSGMGDKENREGQVSEISKGLKQLAKDFDVPIMALSQLSRNVEARANKRPILSDLRESGSIEQDADSVWFIFRPDYYDISERADKEDLKGVAKIIVAKN